MAETDRGSRFRHSGGTYPNILSFPESRQPGDEISPQRVRDWPDEKIQKAKSTAQGTTCDRTNDKERPRERGSPRRYRRSESFKVNGQGMKNGVAGQSLKSLTTRIPCESRRSVVYHDGGPTMEGRSASAHEEARRWRAKRCPSS
jgi:hypothetical protein